MDLIKRTFQHIEGINPKKEKLLWEEGVFDWQDAIEKIDYYAMPKSIKESLKEELPESIYLRVAAAKESWHSVLTLILDTPRSIAFLIMSAGIPVPP